MPEISELQVMVWLERYGISFQDIVMTVVTSSALLVLVFIFLFLGMSAFSGENSSLQASINSGITGIAALLSNRVSGGESADYAKRKLSMLVAKIMEQYRIDFESDAFLFGVEESLSAMMARAHTKGVL